MALPTAAHERRLKHRRSIDVQVFARGDKLWEVDARITDVRAADTPIATGLLRAGSPIHDMLVRLVVDERFNILEAGAETFAMPYPGQCNDYGDVYGRLVGLNLMDSFRGNVKKRLGGIQGCTHITELTQVLPTAVVQAFAGEVLDTRGDGTVQPFQIDRCHALRADGPAVKTYYPRWYRPKASTADAAPSPAQSPSQSGAPLTSET